MLVTILYFLALFFPFFVAGCLPAKWFHDKYLENMQMVEARAKAWVKAVIIYAALTAVWVFVLIALRDTNMEFWTILVSGSCMLSFFLGLWIVKRETDRLADEVSTDKMRRHERKEAEPESPRRSSSRARHH